MFNGQLFDFAGRRPFDSVPCNRIRTMFKYSFVSIRLDSLRVLKNVYADRTTQRRLIEAGQDKNQQNKTRTRRNLNKSDTNMNIDETDQREMGACSMFYVCFGGTNEIEIGALSNGTAFEGMARVPHKNRFGAIACE